MARHLVQFFVPLVQIPVPGESPRQTWLGLWADPLTWRREGPWLQIHQTVSHGGKRRHSSRKRGWILGSHNTSLLWSRGWRDLQKHEDRDPLTGALWTLRACVCACSVTQSCPTLCDPMDYSLPGSSVHGILQARILQWFTIASSRGSSRPRDPIHTFCIGRQILYHWATCEVHEPQLEHSKNPVHVIVETDRVIQNKIATQKNDCEWLQNHLQNIVSLCIFLRTRSIYLIRLSRIIFKRLLGDLREEKEKLLTELRSQKLPGKIKPYVLAWHHTDTAGRIHQSWARKTVLFKNTTTKTDTGKSQHVCPQSHSSGLPWCSDSQESTCNAGDLGWIPGLERSPEKEMAIHSSTLSWRIPWTEEPGPAVHGLQGLRSRTWLSDWHYYCAQ